MQQPYMGPGHRATGGGTEKAPNGALLRFAATRTFPFICRSSADAARHLPASQNLGTPRHQIFEQGAAAVAVATDVDKLGHSARSTRLRSLIATSFSPKRPTCSPAAPCASSPSASFLCQR